METKNNDKNITYILENIITKARYNEELEQYEIKEEDYINLNLSTNQKRLLKEICQNLGIFLEYTDPTQIELPSYEDETLFEEYNKVKRMLDSNTLSEKEKNELEQIRITLRNQIVSSNMMLIEAIIQRRTEWIEEVNYKEDIYQIGYEVLIKYIDENYLVPGELKNDISKRIMPYINRHMFLQQGMIKLSEKNLKTISKKKLEILKYIIEPMISIEEELERLNEEENDEIFSTNDESSPLYSDSFESTLIEKNDKKRIISKIISTLPKQEQEILKLYFGFETGINYSIIEIAKMYNVTKSRIFTIITKSLKSISNSIRIIYLSELYEIEPTYQFDESIHEKLEVFLIRAIEEELLNKILKKLNKKEQEILYLYLDNPELTKLEISKVMNISSYSTTKIKDKIFKTIRTIVSEYLQTKYNKEISYEEYLKYLMELYINKKDNHPEKRKLPRTKRKD